MQTSGQDPTRAQSLRPGETALHLDRLQQPFQLHPHAPSAAMEEATKGSLFENLASTMPFKVGSPMGCLKQTPSEAFIANLSDQTLIITALLPDDADDLRNLVFTILDTDEALGTDPALFKGLDRERTLKPGEVAQLALRKPTVARHVSLFRVRKEGQASGCFLKYTVDEGASPTPSAITFAGIQNALGKVESIYPHLLYIW